MSNPTPQTPSNRPDFPAMEKDIADFWKKKDIFKRSLDERPESKPFTFYDGPPFATGTPHHGHLLQSTIKDAIPRYWTMQGYRVERKWGWDCHGLPVENMIEKELGLNSKRDIISYGMDKFNAACRASVLRYDGEWRKYIDRIGRWVDMENAYMTMDDTFIESVWWVFAELYKKDLIYKDFRVSLYCPRCATPLSNHEVTMDHSYRDVEDPAVTVKFKVKGEENLFLLAWTTTPWTLPANTAIAVNPDLFYLKIRLPGSEEVFIVAEDRKDAVIKDIQASGRDFAFEDVKVLGKQKGKELVGLHYEPLYSFMSVEGDGYRVVDMPYVSATDGTGLVHTAPAFGEEDFQASKVHDLPILLSVDDEGQMKPELGAFAGLPIKQADPLVIKDLTDRGLLLADSTITHAVPECWRCHTALMYRAQDAWFVNIQKLKHKLLEANKKIHWVPEHIKDGRFGKGLEMAPDWCISRTRYWGAPLPVWECESCKSIRVFSSASELKSSLDVVRDFDMHRPGIDSVEVPCTCGGIMKRSEFVFDCWFESGSMPYASEHYPFEDAERFQARFPADFIGEAQDQTRGWFYTMHVIACGLFGKPAAKNITVTGMILAADGKKMSKSQKNFTDPYELMETYGADALRFYLLSSPLLQAEAINFKDEEIALIQRTVFGMLWNIRQFYLTYAGDAKIEITRPRSLHVLDRWIFSRLETLIRDMTSSMDGYHLSEALRPVRDFIDDLSTWWLRRSRARFKQDEDADDRLDALRTLREILLETSKLLAPFTPFFAERLYQDLEGGKMSVHLDRWPKQDERAIDEGLEREMLLVRQIVTQGLDARVRAKLPVRQALASVKVTVAADDTWRRLSGRPDMSALIRDELNVEEVAFDWNAPAGAEFAVALDTELTPELKRKGLERELVRHIMQLRKGMELTPADRVDLTLAVADPSLIDTLGSLKDSVAKEVRADQILIGMETDAPIGALMKWENAEIQISIKKN